MKTRISTFVAGMATTLLISTMTVTALAASGTLNLTVTGINIKVNGEVFKPTDVNGKEVLVFAYNGTTYAPLRALAEAYDLEVGYDAKENLAMVGKPGTLPSTTPSENGELTYEEFKAMWKVVAVPPHENGSDGVREAHYTGTLGYEEFKVWWNENLDVLKGYAARFEQEIPKVDQYYVTFYYKMSVACTANDGKAHSVDDGGRAYEWLKMN